MTTPRAKDESLSIDLLTDRLDLAAEMTDLDRERFLFFAKTLLPEAFHLALPDRPTSCLPGSPEKKEIMRLRVERNESPYHPEDCQGPARIAVSGRKGGDSPRAERKGNKHRAVVKRIKAGSFRTAREAVAAAAAAHTAAKRAIQDAQDAAR